MNYKYDVFISYNWKDSKFVEALAEFLTENSIDCFLDKSELNVYDKLDSKLKKNVIKSKYLVSVISRNYLNSYWCLFEAIEAIQNQEFKIKFLPVVIKYNKDDPTLNEDLVFELMEDLALEIDSFEKRLIKNKAFELASKLEKLNFIRSNLPKVFQHIQQNIYPVFELWNSQNINENIVELTKFIAPKSNPQADSFNFRHIDEDEETNFIVPLINKLPVIRWSTYIGKQKWKNNPLIIGNNIYVGSAGKEWNKPDDEDGIYCINGTNGLVRWFHPTYSDVNELCYSDGLIAGGCDDGKLFCISARTGTLKWESELDAEVLSKPIKYTNYTGFEGFIVSTRSGKIHIVDLLKGEIAATHDVGGNILGNCNLTEIDRERFLFVPTTQGKIVILNELIGGKFDIIANYEIPYPDKYSDTGYSTAELYSAPLIINGILYQGFARETYYDYPAVLAIDLKAGKIKWVAGDTKKLSAHYGNLRTNLLFDNDEIIFITPYSNELVGLDAETGEVKWVVQLGREIFQQWSSPIMHNGNYYVARHDGYFYKVSKENHKREWGIYLGENSDAGIVFDSTQTQINESDYNTWNVQKGFPLLSTPQSLGDDIIVGSDEGFIYRITNV